MKETQKWRPALGSAVQRERNIRTVKKFRLGDKLFVKAKRRREGPIFNPGKKLDAGKPLAEYEIA